MSAVKSVYVVQHEHEWCGHDEVKFIGVYAKREDADAAIERLQNQPGFSDWPDGFSVNSFEIGEDHWCEGFHTMVIILVPSTANPDEFQAVETIWRPGDLYRIEYLEDPEKYKFSAGDVVRCEEKLIEGATALVAIALATSR